MATDYVYVHTNEDDFWLVFDGKESWDRFRAVFKEYNLNDFTDYKKERTPPENVLEIAKEMRPATLGSVSDLDIELEAVGNTESRYDVLLAFEMAFGIMLGEVVDLSVERE